MAVRGAPLVLMHMRGPPADMHAHAVYGDVVGDVARDLRARVERPSAAASPGTGSVLDPGLGFRETRRAQHRGWPGSPAARPGRPLVAGPSRKSFLTAALGGPAPPTRDWGTAAAVTAAVLAGRAHRPRAPVEEMVQVVRVADKIRSASTEA